MKKKDDSRTTQTVVCNAPARLKRLIQRGLSRKNCFVYLDDVIVVGETFDEDLKNLDVFLRDAILQLRPKKCDLFQKVSILVIWYLKM